MHLTHLKPSIHQLLGLYMQVRQQTVGWFGGVELLDTEVGLAADGCLVEGDEFLDDIGLGWQM